MKLERLLRKWGHWGRRKVREEIRQEKVSVNGRVVRESTVLVGPFDEVSYGQKVVQQRIPRHLMLHKPEGVVSATKDLEHETVVDLVAESWSSELHLAGRLDRFTSGLMVLTNDSFFSERLTSPESRLGKRYRVRCDLPISVEAKESFEKGMWFDKEGVQIQPAQVKLLSERECLLTIFEGKHHQVKRMFARFGIQVVALHREAMGWLELDESLEPGKWRLLSEEEVRGDSSDS